MRSHVDFQVGSTAVVLSAVGNGATVGTLATVCQHVVLREKEMGQNTMIAETNGEARAKNLTVSNIRKN